MSNHIHPSAVVSAKAQLGKGNTVGPFVVIEDDVVIGDDNEFLAGCNIKSGVRLANANSVHEHAVLGGLPQDLGFSKESVSYVEIGNRNTFREGVTIHRASKQDQSTVLGDDNFLMVQAHVGHDCRLGNNIVIAPSSGLGGFVEVADRAFISGGVMAHQFIRIGSFAMVGGNSKLTQDVLPYMITDGVPGTVHGLNIVGLRRGGFKREEIQALKKAYQLLFRTTQSLDASLAEIRNIDVAVVQNLADFISASKRGFHREKASKAAN